VATSAAVFTRHLGSSTAVFAHEMLTVAIPLMVELTVSVHPDGGYAEEQHVGDAREHQVAVGRMKKKIFLCFFLICIPNFWEKPPLLN
jgi:hypothetical protein